MSWNPAQSSPPASHDPPPDYQEAVRDAGSRSSDSILSVDSQDTVHLAPSYRSTSSAYSRKDNDYDSLPQEVYSPWGGAGTVSSSTLSLGPSESSVHGRRQLLLIYIHGFMGAETSFQKFPAHVHNLVTTTLKETHVVYSKVYPRYKSRRAMNIARDDFSHWLSPHESENTDVILLGHSLGGILTAEVALLQDDPTSSANLFKHCILGLINFDVPFLGMHPGVIGTGLSSLFQPKSKEQSPNIQVSPDDASPVDHAGSVSSGLSSISLDDRSPSPFGLPAQDPNFDPVFPNDVRQVERTQLDGALHFLKKNSGKLRGAVQDYFTSYFEFGGCLADYSGLHNRYRQLKQYEAADDLELQKDSHGRLIRRIRFVNYYSASTGFPKETSSAKMPENLVSDNQLPTPLPGASIVPNEPKLEKEQDAIKHPRPLISVDSSKDDDSLDEMEPTPIEEDEDFHKMGIRDDSKSQQGTADSESDPQISNPGDTDLASALDSLPPLPSLPKEPATFDPSLYDDKDTLKVAQKEHSRLVKAYERAKKDHGKAIKNRQKLTRKLEKKHLEQQKSNKRENEKDNKDKGHFEEAVDTSVKPTPPPLPPRQPAAPKDRKFCALPSGVDPLWVRIFMPDIDEVVAHQSMFMPNKTYYERLVGDTAARIEEWVHDDSTRRMIWEQLQADNFEIA